MARWIPPLTTTRDELDEALTIFRGALGRCVRVELHGSDASGDGRMNHTNRLGRKSLFREQCHVGDDWIDADSGATLQVDNPANGEVVGTVPNFGEVETLAAIESANTAFGVGAGRLPGCVPKCSKIGTT